MMKNCKTCQDSGWSGDYHPCPECELGWGIAEEMAKEQYEQYEKEQYEREMREMEEEYYRKYPHG